MCRFFMSVCLHLRCFLLFMNRQIIWYKSRHFYRSNVTFQYPSYPFRLFGKDFTLNWIVIRYLLPDLITASFFYQIRRISLLVTVEPSMVPRNFLGLKLERNCAFYMISRLMAIQCIHYWKCLRSLLVFAFYPEAIWFHEIFSFQMESERK